MGWARSWDALGLDGLGGMDWDGHGLGWAGKWSTDFVQVDGQRWALLKEWSKD
jgi:hypothetical protein